MAQPIRILIVDDQTLVREGFRKLLELEPDFEIVAIAADGEAAVSAVERLHAQHTPPNVILMDIRMPRMDGIAATRAIKTRWPESHIVILTTFDDVELIQSGIQAGALGYLLKDVNAEQLASIVRTAAQGHVVLQPDIASKLFACITPLTPPLPSSSPAPPGETTTSPTVVNQLTEREHEILKLVARGISNRQIAEKLFLTEGTVKNYVSSILSKLELRDRTQAALFAHEHQLL